MPGLHWLSRIHMLTGILSYVTSPMWFLVLIVSSVLTSIEAVGGHKYFVPGAHTLFPSWPQYRNGEIIVLLSMTCVILFLPKLLGASLVLADRALRAAYGGARKLIESVLFEQLMSMVLAPTMMLFHSSFVLSALFGRSVGWDAQPRGDRGISWREGFMRHRWHLVLGLVWGTAILALAPKFIWWMLPVLIGMVIAVPFTVLTSRNSLGRELRARGLLMTPEETSPPPELAALAANLARAEAVAAGEAPAEAPAARAIEAAAATPAPLASPRGVAAAPAAAMANGHALPALELFVRVPQHAPLAMASSEAATLALASRAA
jgi:membrane glycosyltransferase